MERVHSIPSEVNFEFVYKASPPLPIIQDILSSAITSAICSSLQQRQSETSSKLSFFEKPPVLMKRKIAHTKKVEKMQDKQNCYLETWSWASHSL